LLHRCFISPLPCVTGVIRWMQSVARETFRRDAGSSRLEPACYWPERILICGAMRSEHPCRLETFRGQVMFVALWRQAAIPPASEKFWFFTQS